MAIPTVLNIKVKTNPVIDQSGYFPFRNTLMIKQKLFNKHQRL